MDDVARGLLLAGGAISLFTILHVVLHSLRMRVLENDRKILADRVREQDAILDVVGATDGQSLELKTLLVADLGRVLMRMNDEISAEFQLRLAEVQRLQTEADQATKVAALNKEALEAAQLLVASQVELALAKNARQERLFQILLAVSSAVVGFLLGLGGSVMGRALGWF